jgi:hypothetical protein
VNIERIWFDPDAGEFRVQLPTGREAIVELRGSASPADLRAGRPVVYLDQNHWSQIAGWLNGRRQLRAGEQAAAQAILELAESRRVLLPASGGHFVETTPMYGDPRVELASTIVELSRGWQMRSPLAVRYEELARGIAGAPPIATDVFAPMADEFFAAQRQLPAADDLPSPYRELATEMTVVMSLFDTIVDPQAIPDQGGEAAANAWAARQSKIADYLKTENASQARTREVVKGVVLADVSDDLTKIGVANNLDPTNVVDPLMDRDDVVGEMPFFGRYRQTMYARLRNPNQRWEGNDLIDLLFLNCAAGYADVVIGERTNISYMRQGPQDLGKAQVATTLEEGLALIDDLLA